MNKLDEQHRIRRRLKQLRKLPKLRPTSERAHLIALRQALGVLELEQLEARKPTGERCVFCGIECLDPVGLADFRQWQQVYWDELHAHYSAGVARAFFSQAIDELDPDDEDGWFARLERITA